MQPTPLPNARHRGDGLWTFFGLAWGITWLLGLPLALAFYRRVQPAPYALLAGGLSALGPTLAALLLAAPRGELKQVFGRWRTNPIWILIGLFVPMALHLGATLSYVALGGRPRQWFYPPVQPEHFAALVMFSVWEEFGWRGFAYPRLVTRLGAVWGSLILGVGWALWHLVMLVSAETGAFEWTKLGVFLIDMPLYSLVLAWCFEKGNRSLAVAIAVHAGAHLDNIYRNSQFEWGLQLLRVVVLAIAAAAAARSLQSRPQWSRNPS